MMEHNEYMGKYISYLYRMGQCYINQKLEPYHIGSGQYSYLMILFREDGISQEMLSERIKIDKATAGRAVKKLIEEGYVFRERDPEDGRSYKIYLTQKGIELKPIIIDTLKEWNDLLLHDMDQEDNKQGIELLTIMAENISQRKQLKVKEEIVNRRI